MPGAAARRVRPGPQHGVSDMNTTPLLGCYDDPDLLPAAEALARIDAHVGILTESEDVELRDALGRVLAADVFSPIAVPGHTNSAMDGYAFDGSELPERGERSFRLLGTAWAGKPFLGDVPAGCTVRIMTGAMMPAGTDSVVMQEQVETVGDRISVTGGHRTGQNVREAGEDLERGALVASEGKRIFPAELGLLASLGISRVRVRRRLRVATFSTGDELRSLGESLDPGTIYDSNRHTITGMLERLGTDIVDLGVVRDERAEVRAAFIEAAERADVIISSGGASTGEADYVRETLGALGRVGFWRIAIRPGRPLAFGRVRDALFFGLPGNPVAVMVTFYQFVQPALLRLMGQRPVEATPLVRATCRSRLRKKPGRIEYYRAVLSREADGTPVVRHTGKTGSGLLHTMSDANCFILLPEESASVEPGAEVDVQPFFALV